MAPEEWDVIILGAGLAGLALARQLRPSHRVLIIERRAQRSTGPRIGESLPGSAGVLLQELGLLERFLDGNHRERSAALSVWDRASPVWRDALFDPAGPGWLLDRRAFDLLLYDGALEAGTILQAGCRQTDIVRHADGWQVHLPQQHRTHKAPVLIDATGRSGAVARRLGLNRLADDNLLCIYTFLSSRAGDEDETLRTCADENGWWYTVQIPQGRRVLAYHLDADDPLRQQLRNPEAFLLRARRHTLIAEATQGLEPSPLHYHPAGTAMLDITGMNRAGDGFLAIGDALISFDPISSQGMFHALATAASAAKAIRAGFPDNTDALATFQTEILSVCRYYLTHLHDTYAGPKRFAHAPFWAKRRDRSFMAQGAH